MKIFAKTSSVAVAVAAACLLTSAAMADSFSIGGSSYIQAQSPLAKASVVEGAESLNKKVTGAFLDIGDQTRQDGDDMMKAKTRLRDGLQAIANYERSLNQPDAREILQATLAGQKALGETIANSVNGNSAATTAAGKTIANAHKAAGCGNDCGGGAPVRSVASNSASTISIHSKAGAKKLAENGVTVKSKVMMVYGQQVEGKWFMKMNANSSTGVALGTDNRSFTVVTSDGRILNGRLRGSPATTGTVADLVQDTGSSVVYTENHYTDAVNRSVEGVNSIASGSGDVPAVNTAEIQNPANAIQLDVQAEVQVEEPASVKKPETEEVALNDTSSDCSGWFNCTFGGTQ